MTFIAVEGIEGSGKSTLVAGLAERLRAQGRDVVTTREPGGTPAGDAVRAIFLDRTVAISPVAEALLVNAARAQHVADVIRPSLDAGKIVLCDRFVDSTLAYQGYGRGLDLGMLRHLCAVAAQGIEPDVTLLLDLGVNAARDRLRERAADADRIEAERDAFHDRVRRGFLELARAPRHCVLDGTLAAGDLVEAARRAVDSASASVR